MEHAVDNNLQDAVRDSANVEKGHVYLNVTLCVKLNQATGSRCTLEKKLSRGHHLLKKCDGKNVSTSWAGTQEEVSSTGKFH